MRQFERSRRLLLVGSVLVVALFGDGLLTFAQQKTEPELMWEMRFEEGKPQVVRNDVARLKSEGKVETFPLKAMANRKEKKIVWLDEDGKVRKERTFEDAKRLLVSRDGKFFGVARREFHEGSFELEYFDEQGHSLWKEWIGDTIAMSPTGETVVGGDVMCGEHLTFVDSQGAVRKYKDFKGEAIPVFPADGRYVFCKIHQKDSHYVALFDSKGNRLWKRYEATPREMYIFDVAISSDGKYVAAAFEKSGSIYISVLDIDGNVLWERASKYVRKLVFSEDGKKVVALENNDKQVKTILILKAADGKEAASYQIPRPQGMVFRYYICLMNSERCLFGVDGKNKNGNRIFDLRLYDKKGEQLWNVSFQVDAPEMEWIPYEKAIAIKAGSSFKVFGLWGH